MNKYDPEKFTHKFSVEFFPNETLLGIKTINCEVLLDDDEYHAVSGIELGFLFFTLTYVNLND
jgi:hypothetical protein